MLEMIDLCCYCYVFFWEKMENNFYNFGDFFEVFFCCYFGIDDGVVM